MTENSTATEAAPDSGDAHLETLLADIAGPDRDEASEEAEGPETAESGQSGRDEKGRFVKKQAEEAQAREKQDPVEPQAKEHTKVSHAALHEERERRKELQAQLRERDERQAKMEERLSQLMAALNAPGSEAAEEDPIAKLNRLDKTVNEIHSTSERQRKQGEEESRFVQRYTESARAFAQDAPDFMEAYNYLMNDRLKELQALGLTGDDAQAELVANERYIVEKAYAAERNPAEAIYELAKHRGYGRKAEGQDSEKKIERFDKGASASKSLGSGGKPPQALSLDNLADMSDEEFSRVWSQYEKSARTRR